MAQQKMKKHPTLEEKEVLETQKALLEEKLNIHLDFWIADKWLLEKDLSEAKRTHASEEAHQIQETAELDLSLGLLQQENFILKLKLEKALDDIEDLQVNIEILQLQLEKKKARVLEQCAADQKIYVSKKEAISLDEAVIQPENYTEQLKCIQKAHELDITEERRKTDTLKKQLHELEILYKEQLVNERQKLQKLEWELAGLQENQAKEEEKHKQVHDLEQQVLKLQEKHQRELEKQRGEIQKISSQRKKEVVALVREKQFVWDQLKRMEEDYASRLKKKDEQLQSARTEISNFCSVTEEMQRLNNERAVDLTILRIEKERAQQEVHMLKEAMMIKVENGKVYQELKRVVHQGGERSHHFTKYVARSDSNTEIEINHQLTSTNRLSSQQNKAIQESVLEDDNSVMNCNSSVDGNEVWVELKEIRRQFEETVSLLNIKGEELKRTSRRLEDLRLENDNLGVLYKDLEAKYNEKKNPDKLSRNAKKDTTTRNRNTELEAAASDVLEDASLRSDSRITRSKTIVKIVPGKMPKKSKERSSETETAFVEVQSQIKGKRTSSEIVQGVESFSKSKRARASKSGQSGGTQSKQKLTGDSILSKHTFPVKAFFPSSFGIPNVKPPNLHLQ